MKHFVRIFAMILAVMMLSTTALAAPFVGDIEKKEAPEVLIQADVQNKDCRALIRDANGNELGMIPDKDFVITALNDIIGEEKNPDVKPEIEKRLLDAYDQLRKEKLVEVVPDIEKALKNKRLNRQVGELVVHDLFDLSADDKYSDMLEADGNNVSVTFKTRDIELEKDEIVFVIQNYEEDKWRIVPDNLIVHGKDDNEFTVTLDGLTPVAFLVEPGYGEGSVNQDFVPSAEQSGVPAIASMGEDEDKIIVAVVKAPGDEEISRVRIDNLVQIPLMDADKYGESELSQAYKDITETENLGALVPGLNDQIAELCPELTAEDLVVRDLFELHLTGDDAELLSVDGNTVTLIFELGLKPDQILSVLHKYDSENWEVIDNDCVVREPNGNAVVTFDSLSPVAFAVADIPADKVANAEAAFAETPSGETSEENTAVDEKSGNGGLIAGIAVAVAAVAGGAYAIIRKKKK